MPNAFCAKKDIVHVALEQKAYSLNMRDKVTYLALDCFSWGWKDAVQNSLTQH